MYGYNYNEQKWNVTETIVVPYVQNALYFQQKVRAL